ncbi:hypothetical protein FGB62_294g06 [Gracilaria domingensis]|nr:hypothetical protein FGB62_294g06 [Gracilaria domingensis]
MESNGVRSSPRSKLIFACHPCRKRFPNKLLLENHLQRTHGGLCDNQILPSETDSSTATISIVAKVHNVLTHSSGEQDAQALPSEGSEASPFLANYEQGIVENEEVNNVDNGIESVSATPEFLPRSPLPDTGCAAVRTWVFFNSLEDTHEELFSEVKTLSPPIEHLSSASRASIRHCTENYLTEGEAKGLYHYACEIQRDSPAEYHSFRGDFQTAEAFSSYLQRARKYRARSEGWKRAVIKTEHGLNRTGVFRPVLRLLLEVINSAGGSKAVVRFREDTERGERVYSNIGNGDALKEYQNAIGDAGIPVLIDLYSDSTTMSSSGTQSANNVRVRFSNIRGFDKIWHEIGIAPVLSKSSEILSQTKRREEKNELWHRFIFLSLRDIMASSHTGIAIDGVRLYPRLGVHVAYQVQERPASGLKGHDSYYDCSHCLTPSKRKRVSLSENTAPKKKSLRRDFDIESQGTSSQLCSEQSEADTTKHCNEVLEVREIQLSAHTFPQRDVYKTVSAQLKVAKTKKKSPGTFVHQSPIRDCIAFLDGHSALRFPSVLGAFSGAASPPYRLYSSIGFDMLHVLEHGTMRQLTDNAYMVFEKAPEYYGMSRAYAVDIANQRIMDLPAVCRLRKFSPFRKGPNEKHAGVTGLMRRELNPYLWVSVMGISKSTKPDEDRLVQVFLKLDWFHRQLIGANVGPHRSKRTLKDIQKIGKLGYEVGKEVTVLLDSSVTTKNHRTMFHISNHLFDYGCVRKGSTDANETLHKLTKAGYNATNKHLLNLAPQLLKARTKFVAQDEGRSHFAVKTLLLTRREKRVEGTVRRCHHESNVSGPQFSEDKTLNSKMNQIVSATSNPEEAEKNICTACHPSTSDF